VRIQFQVLDEEGRCIGGLFPCAASCQATPAKLLGRGLRARAQTNSLRYKISRASSYTRLTGKPTMLK
jgi:hypothetical protein